MAHVYERFGLTVIPPIEAVHDTSTFDSSLPSSTLYSGGEYDHLGGERANPVPGTIRLQGTIVSTDDGDKNAQTLALRARRGSRDRLVRRVQGSDAREWTWARLNSVQLAESPDTWTVRRRYRAGQPPDNVTLLPFSLDFKLYAPVWYGRRRGGPWTLDSGVALDTGYSFDMSDVTALLGGGVTTLVLPNAGNAIVANAIVTIRNPAGGTAITNLVMTAGPDASTVKATWTYTGTIAPNTSLVIDTGAQSVLNNGVNDYAHFTWTASVIDDWLFLYSGSTTMTITLTGGGSGANAATVAVDYAEGWE